MNIDSIIIATATVKRFRLLQPYFGYLSCIPFVDMTHKFKECLQFEQENKKTLKM